MATSTRQVTITKKIDGSVVTIYPSTQSSLVQVGTGTLDTELASVKKTIVSNTNKISALQNALALSTSYDSSTRTLTLNLSK